MGVTRFILAGLVGAALLVVGPASLRAHHFLFLSAQHTAYGVSQFNYGGITGNSSAPLKLVNPNHVTQIAAIIIYNVDFEPEETEQFQNCAVRRLTPHSAVSIEEDVFSNPEYAEVIWAPENKVTARLHPVRRIVSSTRLADGLGGNALGGAQGNLGHWYLGHPSLFTLPSNEVVSGQEEAAIDCVCEELSDISGAPADVFEDFGIDCVNGP